MSVNSINPHLIPFKAMIMYNAITSSIGYGVIETWLMAFMFLSSSLDVIYSHKRIISWGFISYIASIQILNFIE